MAIKRLEAVTETGRHIGTYEIFDAMLLFKGGATIKGGKIVVDEKRCGAIDEDHGWRAIREFDGSDSYWTNDAFEERFGIAFASNIASMRDVKRFTSPKAEARAGVSQKSTPTNKPHRSEKRRNTADKAANDTEPMDTESKSGAIDKYAHSHTRQIPPALGYHWVWENGSIYCVDDEGRKISEPYLKSEIEVYWEDEKLVQKTKPHDWPQHDEQAELSSRKYSWSHGGGYGDRLEFNKTNVYKNPRTVELPEHEELKRRNEELLRQAMLEHSNDALKPAGWKTTQRHNEDKAREEQRQKNRKKREDAADRKHKAAAKKDAEAETRRRAVARTSTTDDKVISPTNASATAREKPLNMTDKQCLLKALSDIEDPFVAGAIKSMFQSINMTGIVERALMLLRGEPREDKPISLDPFATENVIRYRYCKTDSIRLYCFHIIAEAIARKVSEANAEGPEPYIWALENSKDKQGPRKRAAMSILNDTEHLILFSNDIVRKASSCIDELTILPYPTTLIRIEGIPNTWGAVAYESPKGIEVVTIGERPCEKIARRLLAYIENHCIAQSFDGYKVNFEAITKTPEPNQNHFAEPTAPFPKTIDQRTHVIKSEAKKEVSGSRTRCRKTPSSIAPYTRRGHLRHQHYGKGNSQIKLIHIAPTVVKPRGDGTVPFEQRVHVVV